MKKLIIPFLLIVGLFAEDCMQYYQLEKEYLEKAEKQKMPIFDSGISVEGPSEMDFFDNVSKNTYANLSASYGIMFRNCMIKKCLEGNCKDGKCLKIFW